MKEFSNEELSQLLINKVSELKKSKVEIEELSCKLEEKNVHLVKVQSQLLEHNEKLEELVKEKTEQLLKASKLATIGELSARIAHDLRNPLNVLKNSMEILKMELEPEATPRINENFERLDRAVFRIAHQVEDVLDYIKPTKLKISEHSLLHVLQEALERVIIPKNITLKITKKDCIVECDNEKIEILFVNLISNAVQAFERKKGMITVRFQKDEDYTIIRISDDGPGIPSDKINKIFDPLFTTRQVGTGLGLPSCKNIVQRHGGEISVSSKEGEGTTFTITLANKPEFDLVGHEFSNKIANDNTLRQVKP
jgi:signal transduction histidine kinase